VADRECKARIDPAPVDNDRAGAALAAVASLLCSGQIELLTQEIEQRDPRIGKRDLAPHAVDDEIDRVAHAKLRAVLGFEHRRGRYPR
jgi:hypothetical protein